MKLHNIIVVLSHMIEVLFQTFSPIVGHMMKVGENCNFFLVISEFVENFQKPLEYS